MNSIGAEFYFPKTMDNCMEVQVEKPITDRDAVMGILDPLDSISVSCLQLGTTGQMEGVGPSD